MYLVRTPVLSLQLPVYTFHACINLQLVFPRFFSISFFLIVECVISKKAELSNDTKVTMKYLIPLVILVAYFLLSLAVFIYQRRLIQNTRILCQQYEARINGNQKEELGTSTYIYYYIFYKILIQCSSTINGNLYMQNRNIVFSGYQLFTTI